MQERLTIDDVYDIAAEVAEETVTRFLTNLVKLVPNSEDVVDGIRKAQYEELKSLRRKSSSNLKESASRRIVEEEDDEDEGPIIDVDESQEEYDEFAEIAHPRKANNNIDVFSSLKDINLEVSDLAGEAARAPGD